MLFANNVVVKNLIIEGNITNSSTMSTCGIVGGKIDSSRPDLEFNGIGGTANLNGYAWNGVGLFGKVNLREGNGRMLLSDWYSELIPIAGQLSSVGGVYGATDVGSGIAVTNGWVSILNSAGEGNGAYPLTGDTSPIQASNVYVDGSKMPSSPGSGYVIKTTDEMFKMDTFSSFAWDTIWYIDEGIDYPRFIFASSKTNDYVLWLYDTPLPPPLTESNAIDEFRAGKIMKYRIYDVSGGIENAKDITTVATLSFLPMKDSEIAPDKQVEIDNSIKYIKVNDSGELKAIVSYDDKTSDTSFEVYGPDSFSLSESFTETFIKNVPRKGQITAHYRDDYKEVLAPLPDFVTPINDMFVINEASIKPLEVGTHQIEVKRFRTKERFDIVVDPLSTPEIVDVINTAATLYVFFRLDAKLDVDTYFSVRAFSDEAKTIELNSKTTVANIDDFTITIDGAGSWQPIPQSALSPSGEDSEMYCCRIYAGPLDKVYLDLGIATGEETEDIYAPLISATPPPGIYNMPVAVKFTLNEPGDIFFTYEDGIPDIPYQEGESIVLTKTNTLKVRAVDEKGNVSRIVSYKYVIDAVAPNVGANPPPAPYMEPINIELTVDELEATIYYTTDGSEPDINSEVYSMPIPLEDGAITIKAFAIDSAGNVGEVVTLQYEVVANPKGGSFEDPIILNQPVGTVNISYAFNQFDEVYQRFDDFVVEATYKITIKDIPEGGDGSVVIFDGNKSYIASEWVKNSVTFTATTQTMYIMIAMYSTKFDPIKTLIELE